VTTMANTVPVGLVMAVTAQINSQKRVNLNVRPTVSKVLRYIEDPNPQLGSGSTRIISSIPEIQVREMESVLNIASGNVAVLGGLMQEDQRDFKDRVPGLASIPIIGYVFQGLNQAARKTELVVFLRPTVIGLADVKTGDLQSFEPLLPESLPADAFDLKIEESL
jgi:MSHA biogenesis protein MshL